MSRKKRERSSNLSDADIARIVSILDGWKGKITWDLLILEAKLWLHGQEYTRQTFAKYPRIKKAYELAKQRWRNTRDGAEDDHPKKRNDMSAEFHLLKEENDKLKAENARLKMENNNLLEQFVRWQYNADSRGVKKSELDQELPYIERRKIVI